MRRTIAATILATVLAVGWACRCAAQGAATLPSPATSAAIAPLVATLTDPNALPHERAVAARRLLALNNAQVIEMLAGFLRRGGNLAAQLAVVEAVAGQRDQRREFVEPLMAMLSSTEPAARVTVAETLMRYHNFGVREKLLALARDGRSPAATRVNVIRAMPLAPDKATAEALVDLLDDREATVRAAAADALSYLSGTDSPTEPAALKSWWEAAKGKDRATWLAELSENQSRLRLSLEEQNARLRDRLAQAIFDSYDAATTSQKATMLAGFLKDGVPEVRLAGLRLTDRLLAANEKVPAEIRDSVKDMLSDWDSRVRQDTAIMIANLNDSNALKSLLGRLAEEESPQVRQSLLKALGQLRKSEALPAVLMEIHSKNDNVAAAAADALARIAGTNAPDPLQRAHAAEALVARYRQIKRAGDSVDLRESLLTAMGVMGDGSFVPVLQQAVKDKAAKVRLAAVISLGKVGQDDSADNLAALTGDEDRGVRQAAVASLGRLGNREHLTIVMKLTQPSVEADAAIRQQAWEALLAILGWCDEETLSSVSEKLAARSDAAAERIKILQMLVERYEAANDARVDPARRWLAAALTRAARPAEAAAYLAKTYAYYRSAGKEDAVEVWNEWFDALLAADDAGCLTAMADQYDAEAFATARRKLFDHLSALQQAGKHAQAVLLATEATVRLPHRLTSRERAAMEKTIRESKERQLAIYQETVHRLAPALVGEDETASKNAADTILAMSDGAVLPLLAELRNAVSAPQGNPRAEKAIVDLLRQIAPRLTGYDPSAPQAAKYALIDAWAKRLSD